MRKTYRSVSIPESSYLKIKTLAELRGKPVATYIIEILEAHALMHTARAALNL